MLWPLARAVHSRDVEQRLLQLQTQLWRMERMVPSFPLGNYPVSNNFPLPPVSPTSDCSAVCIDGTPTIPIGDGYAYRRLSIDGINLDYDEALGYWVSGTLPTPHTCAGVDQDVRWKFSATGVGPGDALLEFQYYNTGLMDWDTIAEYENPSVWNTDCGLHFPEATNEIIVCSTPGDSPLPEPVCVNPVNLCDGEASFSFFSSSRVLTFTVAGVGGGGSGYNRAWSLTYAGVVGAMFVENASGLQSSIAAIGDNIRLRFPTGISYSAPHAATYSAAKCDVLIPGVTRFEFVSNTLYSGWPSYIDVTCT